MANSFAWVDDINALKNFFKRNVFRVKGFMGFAVVPSRFLGFLGGSFPEGNSKLKLRWK